MTDDEIAPVLVFYFKKGCSKCNQMIKNWNDIVKKINKENSKIKILQIFADRYGRFDVDKYPKMLKVYDVPPSVLLIPGQLWNRATENLGKDNNVEIKEGVQIFGFKWVKGKLTFDKDLKLRSDKPISDILLTWLKQALENKDFKRAQLGKTKNISDINNILVPTMEKNEVSKTKTADTEEKTEFHPTYNFSENVCYLNLIPKPT